MSDTQTPNSLVTLQCKDCAEVKAETEFPLNPSGQSRRPVCTPCVHRRHLRSRKGNVDRKAYQRGRNRAYAELADRHPEEFRLLVEKYAEEAKLEIEALGGPDVTLKPGARRPGETAADRIAKICEDCAQHHRHNHTCQTCGTTPEQAARVISLINAGKLRIPRNEVTVIRP